MKFNNTYSIARFGNAIKQAMFLFILQAMIGCKGYQEAWVNPHVEASFSNTNRLPSLICKVDSVSIEKAMLFDRWESSGIFLYGSSSSFNYTYRNRSVLQNLEIVKNLPVRQLFFLEMNSPIWPEYQNCKMGNYMTGGMENSASFLTYPELPVSKEIPGFKTEPEIPAITGEEFYNAIIKNPTFFQWWNKNDTLKDYLYCHKNDIFLVAFKQFYDLKARDGVTLVNNYLKNNIIDTNGGAPKGTIEISVVKNKHRINVYWFLLSTLTVYTINLLGFPMNSHKVSVTINAKITDSTGKIVKSYSVEGIGRTTSAIYWGYTFGGSLTKTAPWGLPRTVNTFAVSDGMTKLHQKILEDHDEIFVRLKNE